MGDASFGLGDILGANGKSQSFVAQVIATNDDGTVTLKSGIGDSAEPIIGVAASSSYINRRGIETDDDGNVTYAGDVVMVQRTANSLLVTGTTNSQQVNFDEMIDAATDDIRDDVTDVAKQLDTLDDYAHGVAADVDRLDNIRPRITFGTAAAPGGFIQADSVWFRDLGGGRVDFYFRRATDPGTPTVPPAKASKPATSKPKTTPKPVTLTPSSRGSWRSNGQTDGKVIQASWTSLGNWRGGWFYGSSITSAMSGKTVKSAKLTVSRAKGAGGWGQGVPLHLYLITNSSKGDPNFSGSARNIKLTPGQSVTFNLPASWIAALKSGAARGFGIKGSGKGDYLTCGSSSGKLALTFSAS